ncbi:hypothetical protein [Hyphomicrobium sp.]|uniref:hypothetical protein n=1 Tax=Hyphomicrobium sp. TaxID=82 RepID=UPI002BEE1754|nr:hypothetical protein [Hyphomicrobium sp.]HRN89666.1 hypothetical protein [Hyphomicrobium sp.]HRQ25419.1 hypothetical protein [Hyphomicrobium sp.]
MTYVDPELSRRFAQSCTTAAFGYARAATAAYAAFATQALDFWAQSAKGLERDDYKPSAPYLVTGPRNYRSAMTPAPMETAIPFDFLRFTNALTASPMFAPVRAWWGLFPLEGDPKSWPMAYAMMTAGVPRAVALPAAEANMAAMEAAEVASTSFDRVFASYRTEGGFAMSSVTASSKAALQAFFAAPFATAVKLPWAA